MLIAFDSPKHRDSYSTTLLVQFHVNLNENLLMCHLGDLKIIPALQPYLHLAPSKNIIHTSYSFSKETEIG